MKTLKQGDSGEDVKKLQGLLNLKQDGHFGPITHAVVVNFQKEYNLVADGIVGFVTWNALKANTDNQSSVINGMRDDDVFEKYIMPEGNHHIVNRKSVWIPNFYPGPVPKKWFVLHHTAGWDNPYQTIDIWSKDNKTVGTEWVIGGQHVNNVKKDYDGKVLKAMPSNSFAWHLTIGNNNLHRESIGVEVCSFGGLTKKNGKYYNYVNTEVHPEQVCDIGYEYRGFRYFHKLSDKQIESIEQLMKHTQDTYGIDMRKGIPELIKTKSVKEAFDMYNPTYVASNPGLYTHGNVFKGKNDIFPQQELIDMLLSF